MYIREESGAFAKVDERKEKKHTPTHTRTHTYTRTMRARNLVGVSYYSFESILNGQAFGQPRTRTGRGWRSIAIFLLATLVSAAQFPTPYLYPLMVRSPCVCVDVICVSACASVSNTIGKNTAYCNYISRTFEFPLWRRNRFNPNTRQ